MFRTFISKIFFTISPILVYKVIGNSMEPMYRAGDIVFAKKIWLVRLQAENVVIAKDPRTQRLLLKRIKEIKNNRYFLVGDNDKKSTDSRKFGWIEKPNIIAKVFFCIP